MRLLIHDCCPTSDLWSRNLGIGRIDGCLGEPRCRSVSVVSNEVFVKTWRRERDSNPRYGFPYSGFQDHPFQPLTHPSNPVSTFSLPRNRLVQLVSRWSPELQSRAP